MPVSARDECKATEAMVKAKTQAKAKQEVEAKSAALRSAAALTNLNPFVNPLGYFLGRERIHGFRTSVITAPEPIG